VDGNNAAGHRTRSALLAGDDSTAPPRTVVPAATTSERSAPSYSDQTDQSRAARPVRLVDHRRGSLPPGLSLDPSPACGPAHRHRRHLPVHGRGRRPRQQPHRTEPSSLCHRRRPHVDVTTTTGREGLHVLQDQLTVTGGHGPVHLANQRGSIRPPDSSQPSNGLLSARRRPPALPVQPWGHDSFGQIATRPVTFADSTRSAASPDRDRGGEPWARSTPRPARKSGQLGVAPGTDDRGPASVNWTRDRVHHRNFTTDRAPPVRPFVRERHHILVRIAWQGGEKQPERTSYLSRVPPSA